MDITKLVKPAKDIVIELDDEVEYLMNDEAVAAVERGDRKINLIRLYDGEIRRVEVERIENTLLKEGVTDYLDKKR